jgi:hypothetical protein
LRNLERDRQAGTRRVSAAVHRCFINVSSTTHDMNEIGEHGTELIALRSIGQTGYAEATQIVREACRVAEKVSFSHKCY